MKKTPAIFLASFLLPLGLMLGAVASFNAGIDPYFQFRIADNSQLDNYRGNVYTRTYKAELLTSKPWEVAILGHSIAEIGLDPQYPGFEKGTAVNGCIMGGNLYEVRETLRLALESKELREVILVTTYDQWNTLHEARHDFGKSRLNPKRNVAEHQLEGLFGLATFEAAYNDLRRFRKDQPSIFHPDGFRTMVDPAMVKKGSRYMFWFRGNQMLGGKGGPGKTPHPTRTEIFRDMVRTCLDNNIKLTVVFPPQHALSLETIFLKDRFESFTGIRRAALDVVTEEQPTGTELVTLWDFSGYHKYALEEVPPEGQEHPVMEWFWESDHIRKELGDKVLDRLYGKNDDFGVQLTNENLEMNLIKIREGHQLYQESHPGEVAWLKQLEEEVLAR